MVPCRHGAELLGVFPWRGHNETRYLEYGSIIVITTQAGKSGGLIAMVARRSLVHGEGEAAPQDLIREVSCPEAEVAIKSALVFGGGMKIMNSGRGSFPY